MKEVKNVALSTGLAGGDRTETIQELHKENHKTTCLFLFTNENVIDDSMT